MGNEFSKIRVKTAVEKTTTFPRKKRHSSTTNFMEMNVKACIWLHPGSYKLKWHSKNIMEPLPQPTFGEATINHRVWWVPFRTIYKGWDDFINDNLHVAANDNTRQDSMTPWLTIGDLATAVDNLNSPGTSSDFDYSWDNNGTTVYIKYTEMGKKAYRLLTQLYGKFTINPNISVQRSALPLLALAKVYAEGYYNRGYMNDVDYITLKQIFERDNAGLHVAVNDIANIVRICRYVFYSNSYFIDGWDKPNHPNIGFQETQQTMQDPNNPVTVYTTGNTPSQVNESVSNGQGKDPIISGRTSSTTWPSILGYVTQTGLNMLKAMSSYLKRHQLVGAVSLDRFLARWGVRPPERNQAISIGHMEVPIEITPIFSNSDTAQTGGESLGSYAANGFGEGSFDCSIDVKEFGILLCLKTIIPEETYASGTDPMTKCLTKLDFITPEYDNVGVETITADELITSNIATEVESQAAMYSQIFAFTPRYAKWKKLQDQVTGDYICERYKHLYDRYTLNREFDPASTVSSYVHSKVFTLGADSKQYLKIFYGAPQGEKIWQDYFNCHDVFELITTSKAKPLYDVYDWEHEDGQDIIFNNNGPDNN